MSVGSIIGGGVRLMREQPGTVAIWAAIHLGVVGLGIAAMQPWTAAIVAMQRQPVDPAMPPQLPSGMFGGLFLLYLAMLILMVVAFAAVVRAVVRPTGDRFAYLRLGMDELRLFGLGVILVIAGLIAEMVAILAVVLVAGLVSLVAGHAAAAIAGVLLGLALLCGAFYVQVRLSLSGALTVMRGRIAIRESWRMTRGHFWTLVGVFAVLSVGFILVMIVAVALTSPGLLSAYASMDPTAITAAAQQQIDRQTAGLTAGLIGQLVVSALAGTILGVVFCGAVATAALELGGDMSVADAAGQDRGID
ncbi:hypothetical protein PK98_08380 [Croceibacterium mercuriale]|uniref:Glycerophosphoryl diester phosphodiesterase membrane domain-containing protein n=1 Tax=Croceibacterium mercuriale TaxID=1572751 RepID=A0A0B2C2N7_9SPHN|nr:hypothetical protein [Croceibacterium mercuriale]KHL26435.1 hypothetical protein PK98_08380 [Croceibacterium mercuriale]